MACFTRRQREKMDRLYEESMGKDVLFGWKTPADEKQRYEKQKGGLEGYVVATAQELNTIFGHPHPGEYKVAFDWMAFYPKEVEVIRYHDPEWNSVIDRVKRMFRKPYGKMDYSIHRYWPVISVYDWKSTSCYDKRYPSPMSYLRTANKATTMIWLTPPDTWNKGVSREISYTQQKQLNDLDRRDEIGVAHGIEWHVGGNFDDAPKVVQSMLDYYRGSYKSPPVLNYPHTSLIIPRQE